MFRRLCVVAALAAFASAARGQQAFESAFYPLRVGDTWTYRVGDQTVVVRVVQEEILAYKPAVKGKDETAKVRGFLLESKSGNRVLIEKVAVLNDGVYRFHAAGKDIAPPLCFFKLPSRKGDSWQVDAASEGQAVKGTFIGGEEGVAIAVSAEKTARYNTVTVTCPDLLIGGQKMSITYWFAENIGMVKQRVQMDNVEVVMELIGKKGPGR